MADEKKSVEKLKTIINQSPAKIQLTVQGKVVTLPPGKSVQVSASVAKEMLNYKILVDAESIIPGTDRTAELEQEVMELKAKLATAGVAPAPKAEAKK